MAKPIQPSPSHKYHHLVGNEHVGKIRSTRGGARRCLLGLSSTILFLVLFKYFNVIIKKIEMFFVVLNNSYNSKLSKQHDYIITFLVDQS